jgi:hypothetical protein
MSSIFISFDRVSLVLSKADFDVISNYNMNAPEGTYFYHNDYDCFAYLDVNKNPKWFVFFTNIILENENCYEITDIEYFLDNTKQIPEPSVKLSKEIFNNISNIFTTIDKKLHYFPRSDLFYKFYIRNKDKGTYDITASVKKNDITEFVRLLDWKYSIKLSEDN